MRKIIFLLGLLLITSCSPKIFKEKWTQEKAPEYFKARFETTQGNFDIEAKREWSPNGVDRLYQLIKHDFYTDIALYRVLPKFVVQFGIHNDSLLNNRWSDVKLKDESVIKSNDSMTISFARGGKESRTTQIFINMKNNPRLDKLDYGGVKGFPVIATIINGMETVQKFYANYGPKPAKEQGQIYTKGNTYLKEKYPKLDYITKAYIIK
jgi:peptidyl-prolyl cis-trans isomerase A (cyclophilin A)|tara:strand:- start:592 stop:1218 length:627 start_codon:yes stop_codon:yes gene_type:complete